MTRRREHVKRCTCTVPGHGTRCIVSQEIQDDGLEKLSRRRRQHDKKVIERELDDQ